MEAGTAWVAALVGKSGISPLLKGENGSESKCEVGENKGREVECLFWTGGRNRKGEPDDDGEAPIVLQQELRLAS